MKKALSSNLVGFLMGTAFSLGSVAYGSAPERVEIDRVDAHGSGCPEGTAYVDISPDRQVFTAVFDEFLAIIDPDDPYVSYGDRHKRCDLSLKVNVPAGWQFSIFKADYEGWYDMEQQMTMTQTSTYHFQGNARHSKRSQIKTYNAAKSGEFLFTDRIGVSSFEWSACGGPRNMYITSEIRLSSRNRNSRGAAGINAIEGQFKLQAKFGILWRRC